MFVLSVSGVTLTPGQKVSAVVLHADLLSARVHVSVLPKLLAKKISVSLFCLSECSNTLYCIVLFGVIHGLQHETSQLFPIT